MRVLLMTGLALLQYVSFAQAAVDPQLDNAAMTKSHNTVRASINAGTFQGQPRPARPLLSYTNSDELNAGAQAVSDTCKFAHSGTPGVGENIFVATASGDGPVLWTEKGAVDANWGAEAADFNYTTNTCAAGRQCGHYTQLAWAQSPAPEVGCGATQCTTNSPFGADLPRWVLVVCQYSPAGNDRGQRPYCATGFTPPDCAE